ncbi:MAG: CsgG/HfaB family protein [Thermodesulfovibrionales bacterium]|nr:CsgG/HfaB family protein [Thermodesulfovibrionales bacterium]
MESKQNRVKIFFSCLMLLSLTGCVEAIAYLPSLIEAGGGAIAGLENVDVKAVVSQGISISDLQKIKKVAVVLGTGNQTQTNPSMAFPMTGGDLTNVMADNIALELMQLNYIVIERASIDKVLSEQKLQMSGIADPATAAQVGKILGIDAVVLGNVTSSQKTQISSGFMGIGSGITSAQVISNATMKVVGIEQANVIMMVTLSYKKGQSPTEAAKTMAIALTEKLKNPAGQKVSEK